MKLFIISEVLSDHTSGMAVIAAESLDRCREIFKKEFTRSKMSHDSFSEFYRMRMEEYDSAISEENYTVLDVVGVEEGLIDFVIGGG